MYDTVCPLGNPLQIPENAAEDSQSFTVSQMEAAIEYFLENGFVIIRQAIPKTLCETVRKHFDTDVKNYDGNLLHIGEKFCPNKLNEHRFLVNALSNVQFSRDLPKEIDAYLARALEVLTLDSVRKFHEGCAKTPVRIYTWNHFEANPATFPHHDSYFWRQDLKIAEVTGSWIALEDIQPGAGSFYIYPKSHKAELKEFAESVGKNVESFNVQDPVYKNLVIEYIKAAGLKCTAPFLQAGDMVCWDAKTIHGALITDKPQFSRCSFTAHYTSATGAIKPVEDLRQKLINGVEVGFPRFRLKEALRAKFRGTFEAAKSMLGRESAAA